ncbi:MAG: Recombination endonuclease [Frankiales bacterium]|nr:Recombination endonuclease [Frankiales bacterium]
MKSCLDCGLSKPLEDFPPAKKRSDGRGSYCRLCMRERSKASYRGLAVAGKIVRQRERLPVGIKRCPDCGEVKPHADFPRNRNAKDGLHTYCKPCHNARSKETVERLYGSGKHYRLRRRYGIDEVDFDEMTLDQGDLCALCGNQPAEHVDHDHATGEVRGILCFNCNGMLGQARDRVDILLEGIRYLERSRGAQWITLLVRWDDFLPPSQREAAAASPTS